MFGSVCSMSYMFSGAASSLVCEALRLQELEGAETEDNHALHELQQPIINESFLNSRQQTRPSFRKQHIYAYGDDDDDASYIGGITRPIRRVAGSAHLSYVWGAARGSHPAPARGGSGQPAAFGSAERFGRRSLRQSDRNVKLTQWRASGYVRPRLG